MCSLVVQSNSELKKTICDWWISLLSMGSFRKMRCMSRGTTRAMGGKRLLYFCLAIPFFVWFSSIAKTPAKPLPSPRVASRNCYPMSARATRLSIARAPPEARSFCHTSSSQTDAWLEENEPKHGRWLPRIRLGKWQESTRGLARFAAKKRIRKAVARLKRCKCCWASALPAPQAKEPHWHVCLPRSP